MARYSIGSIVKNKDPKKADYIQIRKDMKEPLVLQPGDFLSVETIQFQKDNVAQLVEKGIISEQQAEESLARIVKGEEARKAKNNGKDFVRADVFVSRK